MKQMILVQFEKEEYGACLQPISQKCYHYIVFLTFAIWTEAKIEETMDCGQALKKLVAYLNGTLSPAYEIICSETELG